MTIADKRKEYRLINILFKTIYKKKSAKWRGDYLRNKHIFHQIGNNVHLWGGVPSDPYLISIGNNVIIAVSVEFVTHDIFYHSHTVAAQTFTHLFVVSSRQRSMIGRDVKNKNYDKINLIEKTWRKNNEYNITYHGSWYRQPIWNGN